VILFISKQSPEELQKHHKSYLETFLKLQKAESLYIKSGKTDKKVLAYIEALRAIQ
jgi:hypothetical protein